MENKKFVLLANEKVLELIEKALDSYVRSEGLKSIGDVTFITKNLIQIGMIDNQKSTDLLNFIKSLNNVDAELQKEDTKDKKKNKE